MELTPSLTDLSRKISENSEIIQTFLTSNNLPQPSLAPDAPLDFPVPTQNTAIHNARHEAMYAAKTLYDLLWSPEERSLHQFTTFIDATTIRALHHFKVFSLIPLNTSISYTALSNATPLPESTLRRLIRHAMTIGYFTESCDSVSHTSSSALLLRRPAKLALLGFMSELGYPSMGGLLDAMKWWPESQEPAETGFSVAFGVGGSEGIFEYLKREKRMDAVYGAAMKALSENPGMGNDFIVQGFDWASIADGVVVDVGGSTGHTTIPLARAFPSLKVVVQDNSDAFDQVRASVPADLQGRIEFMTHDFFHPQPVKGADVYLLRWILHDWPDAYCVKILRALRPALKKNVRVLVAEAVMPPRGVLPLPQERFVTSSDLLMMAFHNAKERSVEEFVALFKQADPQFQYVGFQSPEGSILAFIEFAFGGTQ